MATTGEKVFSAAMFPPRPGDTRPPGYLYIVLEGRAREQVSAPLGLQRTWQTASLVAALALALALGAGVLIVRRLTRPLRRLALRMQAFELGGVAAPSPQAAPGDEVQTIAAAFDATAARISEQVAEQAARDRAHRDVMAGVAHDLRTPLTALHGHLEALAPADAVQQRHLQAALAQSDKVRRLTQQLFELATLQTLDQVPQRERFRLDELVVDVVQKFELRAPVALAGEAPGRVDCDGDLQLIERALTNLIDNSVRHAGAHGPVRVQLQCDARQARVLVEDRGPGLPDALAQRLAAGVDVREARAVRPDGGIGGLGLAIAQRIAALHGGALRSLPAPQGGTRLALWLPLASAEAGSAGP